MQPQTVDEVKVGENMGERGAMDSARLAELVIIITALQLWVVERCQ